VDVQRRNHALSRPIAGAIDLLAGLVLGVVLSNTPVGFFFASRAVVMLRIGAPDTIWRGPIPMLMGIAGTFVYSLPFAFLVVAMCEPLLGFSPGRAMLGRTNAAAAPRRERWRRAIIVATPWWGLTMALLTGSWVLALVFSIVAIAFLGGALFSIVT
jgi:hypothetical protein